MLAWSLMGRSRKPRIAATAAASVSNDDAIVGARKIVDFIAGFRVEDERSDRNFEKHVDALAAGLVGALPVASSLGFVFGIETKVNESVVAFARFHEHIAAFTTIAAGRATAGNKLLTT